MTARPKKNIRQNPKTTPAGKKDLFQSIPPWMIIAVLLFTAALYFRALFNDFASLDDDTYITGPNPYIRNFSWQGVKDIFSVFFNGNYHPLTTLTYLLEYTWYGLNPFPYHFLNVILHVLNTWLVFKLAEKLSGSQVTGLVAAILFAVHPMHVESVAWISERKDVLYTFFYLSSLLLYLRYLRSGLGRKYYIAALFLFVASLFSKSAAVTLPVLLIAIDLYTGRKLSAGSLAEKIPFFTLSLIFGIAALFSQHVSENTNGLFISYTLVQKVFFIFYSVAFYIVKAVAPFGLSAMHYFPDTNGGSLPWQYYASVPFLFLLGWLILKSGSFRKELVFGTMFFLVTVSVMVYVPVGFTLTAERYTYVSYIGLFYVAGQWITGMEKKQGVKTVLALFTAMVIGFSCVTYERIGIWKDGVVLFSDVIAKNPSVFHAYKVRGNVYSNRGDYKEALTDYNKVMELKPGYVAGLQRRGYIRNKLNDFTDALQDLDHAIRQDSSDAESFMNRGIAHDELGNATQAMLDYNHAIRLNPKFAKAYDNRAVLKAKAGDLSGSMQDINLAISLDPADAGTFSDRGNIRAMQKDFTGSVEDFTYSLKLKPDDDKNYCNRALSRLNLKDTAGACRDFKKAVELGNPNAAQLVKQYCR